jgi:hypothetical protein
LYQIPLPSERWPPQLPRRHGVRYTGTIQALSARSGPGWCCSILDFSVLLTPWNMCGAAWIPNLEEFGQLPHLTKCGTSVLVCGAAALLLRPWSRGTIGIYEKSSPARACFPGSSFAFSFFFPQGSCASANSSPWICTLMHASRLMEHDLVVCESLAGV